MNFPGARWMAAVSVALLGLGPLMVTAEETAEAGQLLLSGEVRQDALHLGTQVSMTIKGLQAQVEVSQRFKNNSASWANATYLYPLPEDSAVSHLRMIVGERVIIGEIQEKQKARANFERAKADGKKATLMEQQRANLFRQELANIAPGETIEIQISYSQQVLYDQGEFRLRMPTTLTPRYIPGVTRADLLESAQIRTSNNGWALPTDQVVDAHLLTPPQRHVQPGTLLNPIEIDIRLEPGMALTKVESASHRLQIERDRLDYRIRFAAGKVSMDRDLELSWTPAPQDAPVAAMFSDQWRGDRYLQLLLMPPRELTQAQVLPRELILIVDTSGSMAGSSIEQARASALLALDQLGPEDRFNLILFNSETHTLFAQSVQATAAYLDEARRSIKQMQAGGGTEMWPALEIAFKHPSSESHLQQIVFVTDGSVGNESELLKLIHRQLGEARLFTVAIGSAPNRFFMRRAAEFGRGSFTEIATGEQVVERMTILLSKLEKPVVSDLTIDWPQPVEVFPRKIPDLYWGEPLVVTAKLPPWPLGANALLRISGKSAGQPWVRDLVLAPASNAQPAAGIPVLAQRFGRDKIAFLEDQLHQSGDVDKARAKILPVALEYQLMSRFTSLVAVDKTPARELSEDSIDRTIPNAMPAGSTMRAVGYPQTAAGSLWHWLLGTFALLGLLVQRLYGYGVERGRYDE